MAIRAPEQGAGRTGNGDMVLQRQDGWKGMSVAQFLMMARFRLSSWDRW